MHTWMQRNRQQVGFIKLPVVRELFPFQAIETTHNDSPPPGHLFITRTPSHSLSPSPSHWAFANTENATRQCHSNGVWDNYTNYDRCLHLPPETPVDGFEPSVELPTIIYYTGYTISLVSLTLAVAVFLRFK